MFNEARLLDCVSYGSSFGHEFQTSIVTLRSGVERRNARWSKPLGQYSVRYDALEPEQHLIVRGAHMACMGSLIAFRLKDWTDFFVEHEPLAVATGEQQRVQLKKTYRFGSLSYVRPIAKPVEGTVKIFADGDLLPATADHTTGFVTFTAMPGQAITWSGEFDVPVRFASDRLDVDPIAARGRQFILSTDVDLIEVRL